MIVSYVATFLFLLMLSCCIIMYYFVLVFPLSLSCLSAQSLQTPLAPTVFTWFRSFNGKAHYGLSAFSSFFLLP